MYEPASHALLNAILQDLDPHIQGEGLRYFYTRLGANFYSIQQTFTHLYGKRDDFQQHLQRLVETMARQYLQRPAALRALDLQREQQADWFLSQEWVAMTLYVDGFAENLADLRQRLPYFQELGVNVIHLMPMLKCPAGASDGGYAVSDFRQIHARFGSMQDLEELVAELQRYGILLVLDVVVNHTSDEHEWAQQARAGDALYQDYYYTFADRTVPDAFEVTMPSIFPDIAPGNFTWDDAMQRWVMTVFNRYQWDLNYSNPAVFIEILDIVLYWANKGADILRLDAVAFLWKKIGSTCQNEREAHLLLQLMKNCCHVSAPGVIFIAEAIVAPVEVVKYFGEDAVNARECEMAYNATLMALIWDAVATKNAKLLTQGIKSLPRKLERATWLNYLRCHDDIGLGFDDHDIWLAGYDPHAHRQFLIDYYTGVFVDSSAKGLPFGVNEATGDARISGSLASLAGLESAIASNDREAIEQAVQVIVLMHSIILSFGGVPLLYYGDALGTLNDLTYLDDPAKANDSRWVNRPRIDWDKAAQRHVPATIEYRLFTAIKKLIAIRKETPAFADFNNRELLSTDNPHLFVFLRAEQAQPNKRVLVVANFSNEAQTLDLSALQQLASFTHHAFCDLYTGRSPEQFDNNLVIPPQQFYWLTND